MANLILIEDDPILADILKDWLELQSHTVTHVDNGLDGLAMLQENSYELVLLDWQLPGMEGIDVCRKYRGAGGAAGVIMFTGKRDFSSQEQALDAGSNDVLEKPFDVNQLGERIRLLLAGKI